MAVKDRREKEVESSIPGRDRLKTLKLVVAYAFGAQDCGNSTTTGQPVSGSWTG